MIPTLKLRILRLRKGSLPKVLQQVRDPGTLPTCLTTESSHTPQPLPIAGLSEAVDQSHGVTLPTASSGVTGFQAPCSLCSVCFSQQN